MRVEDFEELSHEPNCFIFLSHKRNAAQLIPLFGQDTSIKKPAASMFNYALFIFCFLFIDG